MSPLAKSLNDFVWKFLWAMENNSNSKFQTTGNSVQSVNHPVLKRKIEPIIMYIAHLDIYSWRGLSIGAVHWYGELIVDDETHPYGCKRIKLQRPLLASEAKAMNIENKAQGYLSFNYKAGQLTEGFNTEEEAVAEGIKQFKASYEGVLFQGDHCSCSAWKKAIYWPKAFAPLIKELNAIADKFQALNGYEGKERKKVESLDKQFMKRYDAIEELINNSKLCLKKSKVKKSK
jgi:hypothetical protein